MRALQLLDNRTLAVVDLADPPPPGPGEVQVRIGAVALNHIDVWGWRGMAFAKRKLPIVVGAEAAGTIAAVGDGVDDLKPGDSRRALRRRDLRHLRGLPRRPRQFLRERRRHPRLPHRRPRPRADQPRRPASSCRRRPASASSTRPARRSPTARVEHMLFDNAKLTAGPDHPRPGRRQRHRHRRDPARQGGRRDRHHHRRQRREDRRRRRRSAPTTSSTTARSASRASSASSPGSEGVDVVFEHVGPDTFAQSMFCLKRGGVLVTCGSTTGVVVRDQPLPALPAAAAPDRQLRLHDRATSRPSLDKMADGHRAAGDRLGDRARRHRRGAGAPGIAQRLRQDHRNAVSATVKQRHADAGRAGATPRRGRAAEAPRSRASCPQASIDRPRCSAHGRCVAAGARRNRGSRLVRSEFAERRVAGGMRSRLRLVAAVGRDRASRIAARVTRSWPLRRRTPRRESRRRLSREERGRAGRDPRRRLGQFRAGHRRVRLPRELVDGFDPDARASGLIDVDRASSTSSRSATTASRRSSSAPISPTGSCLGVVAHKFGLTGHCPVPRRRPTPHVAAEIERPAEELIGKLVVDRPRRRVRDRRRARARRASRHAGRPAASAAAR